MFSLSPLLLAAAALGSADNLPRGESPRDIVQRAIAAAGLDQKAPAHVSQYKIKGKINISGGARPEWIPMEGELFVESTQRVRVEIQVTFAGSSVRTIIVLNGDKSWQQVGDMVSDLDPAQKVIFSRSFHHDRVTDLKPLLCDKSFKLAALGDSRVNDRPARGIKVSCEGQADVTLYFDRETGLLVKYAYKVTETPGAKGEVNEVYLEKYQSPDLMGPALARLRNAGLDTSDAALLAYLNKQAPRAEDLQQVRTLIHQLGDDSFDQREKACRDLIQLGPVARAMLEESSGSNDPEIARRARRCLHQIRKSTSSETQAAVIQVLACRRSAGAVEALLRFLPAAEKATANEVMAALAYLARREGKQDPTLVRALDDTDETRKAAAAAVLGKDGGKWLRQAGRRLYLQAPRQATLTIAHKDGKPSLELEMYDIHFFNAFEDKVFARPPVPGR